MEIHVILYENIENLLFIFIIESLEIHGYSMSKNIRYLL